MVVIYTVDGNIGSGKSTFIEKLKEYFSGCSRIRFLKEPVDVWLTIMDSEKNIIERFYENQEKYSFCFQMSAYISRLVELKSELSKECDIIFCERSVFTDKNIFAKMLHEDGKINDIEYQVYNMWFDHFLKELPEFKKFYIKTDPNVSYTRIISRNRSGEENITLEYIESCHRCHEEWLKDAIILNGNEDNEINPEMYKKWFKILEDEIEWMK
jgi:deoxyadenosine/deoxycytidine kinase